MENETKKSYNWKKWESLLVAFVTILAFEFVIFPALTAASWIFNTVGFLLGVGLGIFLYEYYKSKFFKK
jgi:hypothetical protein